MLSNCHFRAHKTNLLKTLCVALLSYSLGSCKDSKAPATSTTQKNKHQVAEEQAITQLACGSCYKPTSKHADVWETIATTHPQLFLFMGDNIYADTEDMEKMKAKYAKLTDLPSYQKFCSACKIIPTWDDHDYGKNDAGKEYPKKAESQQIFLNTFGFSKDHPARKQQGIYHSYTHGPEGKQLQIICLDTRYHRSQIERKKVGKRKAYQPNTSPDATILGAEQWAWLEKELAKPADLRIIVSSIQVITEDHAYEKWANIPAERERLFKLLKKADAKRVILLSGDRHLAEFSRIKPEESGLNHDVIEMTSSGMTHANTWDQGNRHRIENSYFKGRNFGSISIDWDKANAPKVSLKIMRIEGKKAAIFREKVIQF